VDGAVSGSRPIASSLAAIYFSGRRVDPPCEFLPGYLVVQLGIEQNGNDLRQRCIIAEAMRRSIHFATMTAMWFLAFAAALTSARYFLVPPRFLLSFEVLALSRHHTLILLHIAGGIVAIAVGLFQFVGSMRNAYPGVHRALGYVYLSAVFLAGCAGLWLVPDTRMFAAQGLSDLTAIDLSRLGLSPSFLGYSASSTFSPNQFFLVMVGFGTLAVAWLLTAALALIRARQLRFEQHRAWMMRSYSLTFAAATIRLAALPLLVLTRDPVVAITCTFWSWILNLVVAEWLIRRGSAVRALNGLAQTIS